MATGNLSGSVPAPSGSSPSGWLGLGLRALIASAFCLTGAVALQADMTGLSGYEAALKETNVARQIVALERFISVTGSDPLKTSALEVLVWDYLRAGTPAQAAHPANALLAIDSGNALALAALVDPGVGGAPGDGSERFQMATRGLSEYGRLQKPAGMAREEFYRLQLRILSTLDGEAGFGYLGQKNYAAAQQYLQQAVATVPNSGRYVYGLALAMLKQKPPQSQGYWYLARAVNLLRGTPQGPQIAEFARAQYVGAGGSDSNWDRFLIAARAPTSATRPQVAQSTTPAGASATTALNQPRISGDARRAVPMPPNSQTAAAAKARDQAQSAPTAVAKPPASKVLALPPSQQPAQATAEAGLQLPPIRKKVFIPRDRPLSLGILI